MRSMKSWCAAVAILCLAAAHRAHAANCNQPAASPALKLNLPGRPFEALASPDGCWIFVSMLPAQSRRNFSGTIDGGIAVVQRDSGKLRIRRIEVVSLTSAGSTGIVLTHDGKLLIAAAGDIVGFLDVGRLESGKGDPVLGIVRDGERAGSVYVDVSADDRLAFVSDEGLRQVTVIDLEQARRTRFAQSSVVGAIPVGTAPVGLAVSGDNRSLYITSEAWHRTTEWPVSCHPETPAQYTERLWAEGALSVVSIEKAAKNPADAVLASIPAGCSPVRVQLSPDSARAYVTARNSNAVLVFSTARLVSDPAHALLATVPVGTAPVGVAVVDNGKIVIATDSSRFGGSGGQDLSVIDASRIQNGSAAVKGTIPAGGFPRELHTTPDGKSLLLTNFDSQELELFDLSRLPSVMIPRGPSPPAR